MGGEGDTSAPSSDTYLTDGASLFRVAGTLRDINDDTLVELEDCHTLELLLLPARETTVLGLRPVPVPRGARAVRAGGGGAATPVAGT